MSRKPMDRHHIVPRVRCRDLGISLNFPGNVRKIRTSKHRTWHTLFGSMTAEEAIETIKREWMLDEKGQAEFQRLTQNVVLLRKRR